MKTTLKHIALGTFIFLLFSQMSFKNNEFFGNYSHVVNREYTFLKLKFNHRFIETYRGCVYLKTKGKWMQEGENVVLYFKDYKGNQITDTLEIKRLDNKIDSLGKYKRLNTEG